MAFKTMSRVLPLLAIITAVSMGGYIAASAITYRVGFPLDDAWIHQTYARNLAAEARWEFLPGEPSGGSTAPFWSAILAIGYVFRIHPYIWTYFLGWVSLTLTVITGYLAWQKLYPDRPRTAIWAAMLLALEWHLVWSAVSGMETALFSFIVLLVLVLLVWEKQNWIAVGGLVGVSVWLRPDGVTLLAPALLRLLVGQAEWRVKIRKGLELLLGFALFCGPYLMFNHRLTGLWLPSTFYAKQAEYAAELAEPYWRRLMEQGLMPLVGVGAILLPGFGLKIYHGLCRRNWGVLSGGLWAGGYLCLYALRLPVTYQHGRYVMPMMAIYFLWGAGGLMEWVDGSASALWRRVVSKAWLYSAIVVLLAFWILGARAYGRDVAFIETEMVTAAKWVEKNTPTEAIIAAHDIGALGYFSQRCLLDLAGLVTPQIIPFLRDEDKIAQFLNEQGADYLVTFPGWYPQLVKQASPVYSTGGKFSPLLGGENMVVYRWSTPP